MKKWGGGGKKASVLAKNYDTLLFTSRPLIRQAAVTTRHHTPFDTHESHRS